LSTRAAATSARRTRGRSRSPRLALVAAAVLLGAAGCRQDMHQAPRYDPLERSDFFADERASRPLVDGTVARGFLRDDRRYYTGRDGTALLQDMPEPLTEALLLRGQDRFNVYCSPCHGRTGEGNGMIVQRGLKAPTSFHADRLRAQPDGYFFDVITNGFGLMQDYAVPIPPRDRWAVVAYVRALQYSRRVPAADLTDADRAQLDGRAGARPGAGPGGSTTHD
jgi:mono/diheme cytochrome c family protein